MSTTITETCFLSAAAAIACCLLSCRGKQVTWVIKSKDLHRKYLCLPYVTFPPPSNEKKTYATFQKSFPTNVSVFPLKFFTPHMKSKMLLKTGICKASYCLISLLKTCISSFLLWPMNTSINICIANKREQNRTENLTRDTHNAGCWGQETVPNGPAGRLLWQQIELPRVDSFVPQIGPWLTQGKGGLCSPGRCSSLKIKLSTN